MWVFYKDVHIYNIGSDSDDFQKAIRIRNDLICVSRKGGFKKRKKSNDNSRFLDGIHVES